MKQAESAGLTDIGRMRKENQDVFFLDDGIGLYVVADGMGGHRAGETASRMVVATLRDSFAAPGGQDGDASGDITLSPEANRLSRAIAAANHAVRQASLKNPAFQGMGSTLSAILLADGTIIGANVGDSPIYLIHENTIQEISEPHTLAAELAAAPPGEAIASDPQHHHILTRAIGAKDEVSAHICEFHGFPGDILVMGSDGLTNKVTREEILESAVSRPPEKACRHLVMLANERGGEDNITILIAKIRPPFGYKPIVKMLIHFFKKVFPGFRNRPAITQRSV